MGVEEIREEAPWHAAHERFYKQVEEYCARGTCQFKKLLNSYMFFHCSFCGTLAAECLLLIAFSTFLFQASYFVLSIAIILFTSAAYWLSNLYFQTKRPAQFLSLRNWFVLLCKKGLSQGAGYSRYHLSLAEATHRFSCHLDEESHSPGPLFHFSLNRLIKRATYQYFQKEKRTMQEILLLVSIHEHVQLIKHVPTDLETHASLANVFLALSRLYRPRDRQVFFSFRKTGQDGDKYRKAIERALQEFKILNHYSPHDPWVLAQLALCYRNLHFPDREAATYEHLLKLRPDDTQALFRLGILWFQQGRVFEGLEIYGKLKNLCLSKAKELIKFYDVHMLSEYVGGEGTEGKHL